MIAQKVILPLLIIGLFAAGCAGPVPAPPSPTEPSALPVVTRTPPLPTPAATRTPGIQANADDLAGLEIIFWHPWDGGDREQAINLLVAAFNSSNPYGLFVRTAARSNLFADVLAAQQGRSEEPSPDVTVGFNYHALAWGQARPLADLGPFIRDPDWGWSEAEAADFYPGFLSQAAPDGTQTGVPFYRTAEILLYNRTWAAELGFTDPPATPAELRTQACTANAALRTDNDPANDFQGGLMLGYQPAALAAWMSAFGGGFLNSGAGERYTFDRAENIDAFTYLRTLLDEGCAWTPADVYPHADFAARRGLFLPTTPAGIPSQLAAMQAAGSSDLWDPIPYPAAAGRAETPFSGPDFVLLADTEQRRLAAWVFTKWMAEPANNLDWFSLTGYFPVREAAFLALEDGPLARAAWISEGAAFPADPGWPQVQWVVSDFTRSLFAPLNSVGEIPGLVAELNMLAETVAQTPP